MGAVADLQRALDLKLSDTVVEKFLNGGAISQADPMDLLPTGTKLRLFHGKADDIVPIEIAERFVQAAKAAGGDAQLSPLEGGHFEPVDPRTPQWALVREEISPHGKVHFFVRCIEVRCNADARARPVIHQNIPARQFLNDSFPVGNRNP